MGNDLRKKNGYSIVLVPIILGLIVGFFSLVFDVTRVFILKHQLQSAVDSAAIAGASMIKVEFAVGEDEKIQLDNINITYVDEKVYSEANRYFEKNIEVLQLKEKGVKILENKGTIQDELKFEYYVKAQMPMIIAPSLLGISNLQIINIRSEAKPTDGPIKWQEIL